MIQIRKIREWTPKGEAKPKKFDKILDPPVTAPSVAELFLNLDSVLSQIDPDDRWNLYYTSHPCETDKRRWAAPQVILPFDIDNIDLDQIDAYHPVILGTLQLARDTTGIVYSGNGLQYVVGLTVPITEEAFFDTYREHYKAICQKIDKALQGVGLPGTADPAVFSAARLLRLPGTENRKAGKASRQARLIQAVITPVEFNLTRVSGLPEVPVTEQIAKTDMANFAVDSEGVRGCEFLKWTKQSPEQVSEPQWFALLSIVGRMENGTTEAHEYSKGHPGYSHSETETKLQQALSSSGPRTCKNINQLWSKCHTCPHFEKVNSPISIRGANFIASEKTGFHVAVRGKGGTLYFKPQYEDLRRYFEREHTYKILGGSRICYIWNGAFYQEFEDAYLENFGQKHFKPSATTEVVGEFRRLVQRTNLVPPSWFDSTTHRKINFQNGVLDLDTLELTPHSIDAGFRYQLAYPYDAAATCPTFDAFLQQVTCGDKDLEAVLLEFCGYALSSDSCWAQKALVLEGSGSNGKSTFMSVLRALAGKDNYASLTLSDLRAEGNRQMLDGKLFNMAEETPSRSLMESSIFKNLVSGGETQVRQIYKKPYVMRNRAKLIFACNDLPGSNDTSLGYFRRFIIVPFKATFSDALGNKDAFIEEKLMRELPGIFNRVLGAFQGLVKRQRFSESMAVSDALDSYRMEVNTVLRFLGEHQMLGGAGEREAAGVDTGLGGQVPGWVKADEAGARFTILSELYEAYRIWCQSVGEEPVTGQRFGKQSAQIIPEYKARSTVKRLGGKLHRVLVMENRVAVTEF